METRSLMREAAAEMLRDVLGLFPAHQGLHRRAARFVRDLNADIPLALDPEFAVLFPGDPTDGLGGEFDMSRFDAALQQHGDEVRHLATMLSWEEPDAVAARIARFDREAAAVEHAWPRHTPLLASELSQRGERPEAWLQATIDAGCAPDVVAPFLMATIRASQSSADWEDLAGRCLEQPTLVGAALHALITHPAPPAHLLRRALEAAGPFEPLIEDCCRRGSVPSDTLRTLLTHDDCIVAAAAAVGEWLFSGGSVTLECAQEWRAAVLRMPDRNHQHVHTLGRILSADPGLARDWLVERMARCEPFYFDYPRGPVQHAVAALDAEARWAVLSAVPDQWGVEELVAALVGDDPELFRRWLTAAHHDGLRLAPLAGRPTDTWAVKAKIAYRAGVRIDTIIRATWTHRHSWSGEESDYWASWERDFARLCNHECQRSRRDPQNRSRKTPHPGQVAARPSAVPAAV